MSGYFEESAQKNRLFSLIAGGTAGNKRKESRIMKELHYGLIMDHVLNGS